MKIAYGIVFAGLAVQSCAAHADEAARADATRRPLGFYVGAEFGLGHINTSVLTPGTPGVTLNKRPAAWAGMFGVRPYKYLGAEIGYIDFGTARRSQLPDGVGNFTNLVQATTKATAVELVGYLPIIPSRWDVFAKAGQGRQSSDFYSYGYYPNVCVGTGSTCAPLGNASLSYSNKQTGFIYGIGTQYQFGKFGLRAEYQSFGGSQPPSMFAIGALWKF